MTVAVKDSRMRENDAILGVVMLKVCLIDRYKMRTGLMLTDLVSM